jgi:carbonic anhydrase
MSWVRRFRRGSNDALVVPGTADEAIRRLLDGNAKFIQDVAPDVVAQSTVLPADLANLAAAPTAAIPKQAPFCAILGCSDARVPSELIFEAGPNECFVVRVAGNILGDECLGSIEYALHNFKDSLRLLVVLGHTGCGAVPATVDAYLNPTRHNSIAFTRSLRAVVNHVLVAVRAAAVSLEAFWGATVVADPGYRSALLEVSVYLNAALTAYHLRQEVQPGGSSGTQVAWAVFDVATCNVIGPDLDENTDDTGHLAAALANSDELVELGRILAGSPMAARHLSQSMVREKYRG